uniref:ATP synthase complex subunit 8 n=1 Tax=Felderimyia fuscipennis TaxID=330475 RepID=A0A7G9XFI7_9MUSC|nr:ATP synthase F0 subunit 8 [Felderimyia fuscipennis]QNO34145.1 ATP synthase F0 subunit 8 [Felderimyia fuscipennis]
MPQMAPISWLLLFTIFSITFILFNVINYYTSAPQLPQSTMLKNKLTTPLNWKW